MFYKKYIKRVDTRDRKGQTCVCDIGQPDKINGNIKTKRYILSYNP